MSFGIDWGHFTGFWTLFVAEHHTNTTSVIDKPKPRRGGGGTQEEVWREVCSQGLQSLTLLKRHETLFYVYDPDLFCFAFRQH